MVMFVCGISLYLFIWSLLCLFRIIIILIINLNN